MQKMNLQERRFGLILVKWVSSLPVPKYRYVMGVWGVITAWDILTFRSSELSKDTSTSIYSHKSLLNFKLQVFIGT